MSETQAYRLRFTPDTFVMIGFDQRTVCPTDNEGEPTCGGAWIPDLELDMLPPGMSSSEKRALVDSNRAKIQAAAKDPRHMHRAIIVSALRLGATPANLLTYAHIIGPKGEIPPGVHATAAGHMEIEELITEEVDGEEVEKTIRRIVPIAQAIAPNIGDPGPDVTVTRLPPEWTLEPA